MGSCNAGLLTVLKHLLFVPFPKSLQYYTLEGKGGGPWRRAMGKKGDLRLLMEVEGTGAVHRLGSPRAFLASATIQIFL